jgi:hypothetical protein
MLRLHSLLDSSIFLFNRATKSPLIPFVAVYPPRQLKHVASNMMREGSAKSWYNRRPMCCACSIKINAQGSSSHDPQTPENKRYFALGAAAVMRRFAGRCEEGGCLVEAIPMLFQNSLSAPTISMQCTREILLKESVVTHPCTNGSHREFDADDSDG